MQERQVHVLHLVVPNAGLQGHNGGQLGDTGSNVQLLGRPSQRIPNESAKQQAKRK